MSEHKPTFFSHFLNFFFWRNHISRVLFLEYSMDEIKSVGGTSHQVSTVYKIPFTWTENFVKYLAQKYFLSRTPVPLNEGQGQLDLRQNVEYNCTCLHSKCE